MATSPPVDESVEPERHIVADERDVLVEVYPTPEDESDAVYSYQYKEVKIYPSGWVEGAEPRREQAASAEAHDLFPPERVIAISYETASSES